MRIAPGGVELLKAASALPLGDKKVWEPVRSPSSARRYFCHDQKSLLGAGDCLTTG